MVFLRVTADISASFSYEVLLSTIISFKLQSNSNGLCTFLGLRAQYNISASGGAVLSQMFY